MLPDRKTVSFQHHAEGTWGEFKTPAGRVAYVLTKARLGTSGTDNERRLTSQLRPVREVLDSKTLNFNQLLQRDLDDHRVATELIPYLLSPKFNGPAFFPPIMAVLLPFDGNDPKSDFPNPEPTKIVDVDGLHMEEVRYGESYQVHKLYNPAREEYHSIKLSRIAWNDEEAKLVVLDGQHRAMALIAIDRTINGTWDKGSGTRYRHFYEHRVESHLEEAEDKNIQLDLDSVEIPVCICWFPDLTNPEDNPHLAARKIFVDVNKEARRPSEARLILLSDNELLNIFTRSLLNRLRESDPPLPLYAIEYDNPDADAARPVRWSVLTNLNLLKDAVQYTLFCPPKFIEMDTKFGGRLPWSEMNERMRDQLEVSSLYPSIIQDGERIIDRASISNDLFPTKDLDELTTRFLDSWGMSILNLLGGLAPYAAHCSAIEEMHDQWLTDDAMASLARDALFVGVGMYWTLRASDQNWTELKAELKTEGKPIPSTPDIVKAWAIISDTKAKEFKGTRALHYLDKATPTSVEQSEALFGVMNTHACQLGALLAMTTLAHHAGLTRKQLCDFSLALVEAWNKALLSNVNQSRDRRLIFAKRDTISNPINRITRMDTPLAVHFRYFWLELLQLEEAWPSIEDWVSRELLELLVEEGREQYLDYLVNEQMKALRQTNPDWDKNKLYEEAQEIEQKELNKALDFWFTPQTQ